MHETSNILPDIKLQFNVQHQVLEDCYRDGYDSARSEKDELENPYEITSKAHAYWTDGWWDGLYDKPSLFTAEVNCEPSEINAANDSVYPAGMDRFLMRFLEISGVLAVSAIVGYQLVELVA